MIESAILIGDFNSHPAFVQKIADAAKSLHLFQNVDQFLKSGPLSSEMILVSQQWSDEYTAADVSALLAACPLARIIVCQQEWCASDGRTRRLWPPAVCSPIGHWELRLEAELDVISGRRPPLPLTAGLEEIFAFDHAPRVTAQS